MKEFNWGFEEAMNFLKSKRPLSNPNFGFKKQLKSYEKDLNTEKRINVFLKKFYT